MTSKSDIVWAIILAWALVMAFLAFSKLETGNGQKKDDINWD